MAEVKVVSKGGPGAVFGAIAAALTSWMLSAGYDTATATAVSGVVVGVLNTAWNWVKHRFL